MTMRRLLGLGTTLVAMTTTMATLGPVAARAADAGADGAGIAGPPPTPVAWPETPVSAPTYGTTVVSADPSVVCGATRCLAAWSAGDRSYAIAVDGDGKPVSAAAMRLEGDVGRRSVAFVGGAASDEFVVAFHTGGTLALVRLAASGGLAAAKTTTVGTTIWDSQLVWNGTHLFVVFRDVTASGDVETRLARFGADLALVGTPTLIDKPVSYLVPLSAFPSGAEVAVLSGAQGWSFRDDGSSSVGPVALPDGLDGGSAVSVNGAAVLLSRGKLYQLGADLQVTRMADTYVATTGGYDAQLAWNGTDLLVAQSDSSLDGHISTARFSPTFAPIDGATLPSGPGQPVVAARGGEFLLFPFRQDGYTPQTYGFFSLPLNAGGRARATTETLVSVTAEDQLFPLVVAQPAGYLVLAEQGQFSLGVLPLGLDGRPTASRPASAISGHRITWPTAIGVGADGGGLGFAGAAFDDRILRFRFDAAGRVLDGVPPELAANVTRTHGALVWTGPSALFLLGDRVAVAGADGSLGPSQTFETASGVNSSTADSMGGTALAAWIARDGDYQPRVARLDATGARLDATAPSFGETFNYPSTGLAVAHDGTGYLVAWDACNVEGSGALTSQMRFELVDASGKPAGAWLALSHFATGAVPPPMGFATPALSTPLAVFDGSVYWVAWREDGVWVRRVSTSGQVLDPSPIKLLNEPFGDVQLASRGDGTLLLVYDRLDGAANVQAHRLMSRVVALVPPPDGGADGGAKEAGGDDGAAADASGGAGTTGAGGGAGASADAAAGTSGDAATIDRGASGKSSGCACDASATPRSPARAVALLFLTFVFVVLASGIRRRARR
jgi:hypothetical protein